MEVVVPFTFSTDCCDGGHSEKVIVINSAHCQIYDKGRLSASPMDSVYFAKYQRS